MRHFIITNMTVIFFLTGCASMFSGTSQTITLKSDNPKTKFYLDEQEVGTGTAVVPVAKKRLPNAVFVGRLPNCSDATTSITTKFDATTLLGILIDYGLISILVVDLGITGSVREAERTNYILNPVCN